ncbi:ArsR family transcriptional regulator [Kribbella amoyensis]|uniref:ArsR family transcriptional regulator n=1 Tax=Kribbella amoyensis TaxID=996641 RepID=A0A561BYQ0_9ACTN|nr:metalloregulator ArsR/SmtB family transcription factor [Kribbella amoyensis]TWD84019.1 ArsR family transcriptional regulator [Kribbella amoyensis]
MGDHAAKAGLFDALAEVGQALGNGRRAELIDVLAQGERPVEELAAEIQQSVANTSHHLQRLLRSGLVRTRRSGTRIYYALAGPAVAKLWSAMREAAEDHASGLERLAQDYLGDRGSLETMTRDELAKRLRTGDIVVLDVRPVPEYASGHLPGAISLPVDELQERLGEVRSGAQVVAYCRGPYCVYADDAVRLLTKNGRTAYRLEDGFPEWSIAGLPVER